MLTFTCPSCNGSVTSPETESGKMLDCPHCNQKVQVPKAKSNTWVVLLCVGGGLLVVGCPMIIFVCLVAISMLGKSPSSTFTTVGQSIGGS